jgi:hypothetical protein
MAQVDSENSTAMPADYACALYIPTDVSPEEVFQAIGRLRKEARDEIDRLIGFLDDTDNHMEREPDLGWPERFGQCAAGGTDDREAEPEHDEHGADDEPSLGSHELPSGAVSYLASVSFGEIDVEGEHDGREPCVDGEPSLCGSADEAGAGGSDQDIEGERFDDEPSLGWPERLRQTAQPGGSDDRELSAETGKRIVDAARSRKWSHCKNDDSGRHVDVDDIRIGTRKIRNLSPKQEKRLAPRIDRGEVRI